MNGLFRRSKDFSIFKTRLPELEDLKSTMEDLKYKDVLGFAVVYPFTYSEIETESLDKNVVLISNDKDSIKNYDWSSLLTSDDIKLIDELGLGQ